MTNIRMLAVALVVLLVGLTACQAPAAPSPKPSQAATTTATASAPPKTTFVKVGGSPGTSAIQAIIIKMVDILNQNVPNARFTAVESSATEENIERLRSGEFQVGASQASPVLQLAYIGLGPYKDKGPMSNARFELVGQGPGYSLIGVRADSNVNSIRDLNGKKFSAGFTGAGSTLMVQNSIEALGVKVDWYSASVDEGLAAAQDKRTVGIGKGEGFGTIGSTLSQLKASTPIKLLGFSKEDVATIQAKEPWLAFQYFPKGFAKEMPEAGDFYLSTYFSCWNSMKDFPEELSYQMAKVFAKNVDQLIPLRPALKGFDLPKETIAHLTAFKSTAPLSAGAVRYAKELGLQVPDALIPPEYKK